MSITFSLMVTKGGKIGQTFRVDRPNAAMGRHTGVNDVVLNDPYISSKHARILYNSGRFYLEDLGSTNKTFVNGVALVPGKPVALSDGMEFTLGKTGFRFQYQTPEESAPDPEQEARKTGGMKDRFGGALNGLSQNKNRYTPILLGIALWALVVVIFWFITIFVL